MFLYSSFHSSSSLLFSKSFIQFNPFTPSPPSLSSFHSFPAPLPLAPEFIRRFPKFNYLFFQFNALFLFCYFFYSSSFPVCSSFPSFLISPKYVTLSLPPKVRRSWGTIQNLIIIFREIFQASPILENFAFV